ncbi:transcription regulator protein BACH1-like [Stigmatopora argus]
MALEGRRVSVFTFQSAVHSAHVLRCLDEQRRRDFLCDLTVVAEGRSFRAHAAVLASCSEYFRVAAADSKRDTVLALPQEVTARGFEPLLQFAYTSKLLFTKENIHHIQSCAKLLGFADLESACFHFLLPKFSVGEAEPGSHRRDRRARPPGPDPSPAFPPRAADPDGGDDDGGLPASSSARPLPGVRDDGAQGRESTRPGPGAEPSEGFLRRSREEREVAEHLAQGFWSESSPAGTAAPLDPEKASSDFAWLRHLDLSSNPSDCPFLRDLDADDVGGEPESRGEAPSPSEKSTSSLNSGDGSDADTDGDSEANRRRAAEVALPFPVEHISTLSRSAFQQLVKRDPMTPEQLDLVHDVRRRSKNRAAAQRCRKRKMDGIHHLDREIAILKGEREKLLEERTQLQHNLAETRRSIGGLRRRAWDGGRGPDRFSPSPPSPEARQDAVDVEPD